MKCEKCDIESENVKPWRVKTLGLAGTFTWNLCPEHTPVADTERPYTPQQIEALLRGESL